MYDYIRSYWDDEDPGLESESDQSWANDYAARHGGGDIDEW